MILPWEVFTFYHIFGFFFFFSDITFNKVMTKFKKNPKLVFQSPCDNSLGEGSRSYSEVVYKTQQTNHNHCRFLQCMKKRRCWFFKGLF